MFENIPHEMRNYPQWLVWRYEDLDAPKPTKVPYSARNHRHASVTDPATWCSYDEAVAELAKSNRYTGIGFVLTNNDPYAFIDLDDTHGDQTAFDRQMTVYKEFDSYAELSPSGKGLHIIIKGSIESGRRRSSIEVYSNQRYMTMTGNIYRDAPIKDHNELLQVLWQQMGGGNVAVAHYAGLAEATESDEEVIARAMRASNGDKFAALYCGDWQNYYPSQSEADFALVDIIAFYTQNRAQIAQIFRASQLGKREKAQRNDYVAYMLNKAFDRMLPPVDLDGLRNLVNETVERAQNAKAAEQQPTHVVTADNTKLQPSKNIYTPPPGLIGAIAQFIYAQAPRPVPEIALAGALGLVAGIVGRSYNVSGTGLNQYVLLLAPTGTGKEAIARGIDKLMNAVCRSVPSAMEFIGPAEIASPQALTKYMSKTAVSFVSVVGEFGIQLKMMASPHAPPHLIGLMRMILDLYNKSGNGNMLRPSIYSDRDKNTSNVLAPAFTWLGESTPEKFYEALDESMITSGLLPRFTTIEYNGNRPAFNPSHNQAQPSFQVIEQLSNLCAYSLTLNSQHKAINVEMTADAKALFDQFDKHCDDNINTSEREVRRHLWNRAHIKALKLSALVAVGMDPYTPTINVDVASWALNLIVADVRTLLSKFDAGEIGVDNDETKQLTTVIKTIREYITLPWSEVERYAAGQARLHQERIIPYSYIQRRLAAAAIFRKDKRGSSDAIKRTLKTLQERGDLQEVSRATLSKNYNTTALCYMIAVPRVFDLG